LLVSLRATVKVSPDRRAEAETILGTAGVERARLGAAGRPATEVVLVLGSEMDDEVGVHSSLLSAFFCTECRMR
jgi:hypothetical protein